MSGLLRGRALWVAVAVIVAIVIVSTTVSGEDIRPRIPEVPPAKGDHCVRPTEFMRRHHMDLLLHHRDETMRRGMRGPKYNLQRCLGCHVNRNADGEYPRYSTDGDSEHFCASCHTYASVEIDCFSCHRETPWNGEEPWGPPKASPSRSTDRASPAIRQQGDEIHLGDLHPFDTTTLTADTGVSP